MLQPGGAPVPAARSLNQATSPQNSLTVTRTTVSACPPLLEFVSLLPPAGALVINRLFLVLLVEDHPDTLEVYARALSLAGCETVTARSADEAFARACDLHPDVVVTDVVLPEGSGLELIRWLRQRDDLSDVPIVVVSGRVFPWDEEQARSAGCDVFLPKPCLPDDLVRELRRLVDDREALERQAQDRIRAEYLEMPGMSLTLKQIRRLCGIGPSVCRQAVDALVADNFLAVTAEGTYRRRDSAAPSIATQRERSRATAQRSDARDQSGFAVSQSTVSR